MGKLSGGICNLQKRIHTKNRSKISTQDTKFNTVQPTVCLHPQATLIKIYYQQYKL